MNEDQKIRQAFAELKRDEERNAPNFDKVWAAASSDAANNRRRRFFLRVIATAAGFMLFGAVAWLINSQPEHVSAPSTRNLPSGLPWQSTVLISQWRSPTDFLLDTTTEGTLPIQVRDIFPQKN